mgnify:CR=1 FL=1
MVVCGVKVFSVYGPVMAVTVRSVVALHGPANVEHDVAALEESEMLLTVHLDARPTASA